MSRPRVPPPPTGWTLPPFALPQSAPKEAAKDSGNKTAAQRGRSPARPFDAEIEIGELDDRNKPSNVWGARARELSRSNLILVSRRMCYIDRVLVVAIHRIDDQPVPLLGKVVSCDYETDGLYRVDLELLPLSEHSPLREWVVNRNMAA